MLTRVGYAGGKSTSPSYRSVCSGDGHTEVMLVAWDADKIEIGEIMRAFRNQIGYRTTCGGKDQYRTVIMTTTDAQEKYVREEAERHSSNIPVERLRGDFYLAEEYHQNYIAKQQQRGR